MITCNNVQQQAHDLADEILDRWRSLLKAGDFILGEEVAQFERWMGQRCNNGIAVATNSGTDALILALRALGIGVGDEVITCANTFVATVGAIISVGARPVLADVRDDELLDIDRITPLVTPQTRAVIPVHLRGRPSPVGPITGYCHNRGIAVIEDCAQAIGATIDGRQVGSDSDVSAFSLHPLKSLGGVGDGGVLVTHSVSIANYARMVRNHGLLERDAVALFGVNSRLDTLQAAALNIKTAYLDLWLQRRREIASYYNAELADTATGTDLGAEHAGNAYYHYVVASSNRSELRRYLVAHDIGAEVHYPTPIHLQSAWKRDQRGVNLPVTERLSETILTLPCHHSLTDHEIEKVAGTVKAFDRLPRK